MRQDPFDLLKNFISPRYREEGPPSYIEGFFNGNFLDNEGKIIEPMRTALDLIVLGYRPVTTLCILTTLIENKNKPLTGRQLGISLEKRLGTEEGRLTEGRYYDDRIGRLLKIMCQLEILEQESPDSEKKKKGYRIKKSILPTIEKRISYFLNGGSLSPLKENSNAFEIEGGQISKQCSRCKSMVTSRDAVYCELCGAPLTISCGNCGKDVFCKWKFCNHCGKSLYIYNLRALAQEEIKKDVLRRKEKMHRFKERYGMEFNPGETFDDIDKRFGGALG